MCSNINSKLTINHLCDDLLCEIFDRLPVKQVLAIRMVSKDFNRCANKWLTTVDQLFFGKLLGRDTSSHQHRHRRRPTYTFITLQKTFDGRQSVTKQQQKKELIDLRFKMNEQNLIVEKLLTNVCTGIKFVDVDFEVNFNADYLPITASEVIHLVRCCPNIANINLSTRFLIIDDDADWNQLVQLIKCCDIHLQVVPLTQRGWSSIRVDHLEQLFVTAANRIKSVRFKSVPPRFLKTIDFLNASSKVVFGFWPEGMIQYEEFYQLICQRVDHLDIRSNEFVSLLSASRNHNFQRLSSLRLLEPNNSNINQVSQINSISEFPRLKRLSIVDSGGLVFKLFSSVPGSLDQLEHLEVLSLYSDSTEMLKKVPNIVELKLVWNNFSQHHISPFEKLFQLLSSPQSSPSTRLRTVWVNMQIRYLGADELGQVIESLVEFASRRTEIKLKCRYFPKFFETNLIYI